MPNINKFDNYDECFGVFKSEATYCYVRTYIKPNMSSDLYRYIAEFSENRKKHFRHDKLDRGICINTCRIKIDQKGDEAGRFFVPEFAMDSIVENDKNFT